MKIKELINANKIYSKPKINGNNLTVLDPGGQNMK